MATQARHRRRATALTHWLIFDIVSRGKAAWAPGANRPGRGKIADSFRFCHKFLIACN